ncbi:MAG: hypothetical protein ABIH86_00860 [Planctomycetota bacterium]
MGKHPDLTWQKFIRIHMNTIIDCDVFQKPITKWHGVKNAYCIAFIHYETRRVYYRYASGGSPSRRSVLTTIGSSSRLATLSCISRHMPVAARHRDNDQLYCKKFDASMINRPDEMLLPMF